jgi:hypothetical protein
MKNDSRSWTLMNWIFFIVFISLALLNMIFVHIVPGLIYLLISFVYLPLSNNLIKKKFGIIMPKLIKIILAVLVLWFTLGVSDLLEIVESWVNK